MLRLPFLGSALPPAFFFFLLPSSLQVMWYESIPSFAIITGSIWAAGVAIKGIHYFFYDEVGRRGKNEGWVKESVQTFNFFTHAPSLFIFFSLSAQSRVARLMGSQNDAARCQNYRLCAETEREYRA